MAPTGLGNAHSLRLMPVKPEWLALSIGQRLVSAENPTALGMEDPFVN